jgi:mannosyltransferase OCH1-like enzyme
MSFEICLVRLSYVFSLDLRFISYMIISKLLDQFSINYNFKCVQIISSLPYLSNSQISKKRVKSSCPIKSVPFRKAKGVLPNLQLACAQAPKLWPKLTTQVTSVMNATSRLSLIVLLSADRDSDPMNMTKKLKLLQRRRLSSRSDSEDWAWAALLQEEVQKKLANSQRWGANFPAFWFHVSNLKSFARLKRRVEQNLTFPLLLANKSDSSRGSIVLVQSNAEAE